MDKTLLRGQLQTIKNNYAMAQLGITLMAQPDALEMFEASLASIGDHPEKSTFEYIWYVFESDDLLRLATKEFRNSALRNSLKETFELVKLYGDKTNQSPAVKAAPWYQFLRMVRNCLSHDMQVQFNSSDLKKLPVKWNGLTLERSMQNSPLPMRDFLSRQKAMELIDAVIDYMELNIR